MREMRWLGAVIGLVVALTGCGGVELSRGPACGETQQEQLECLREIGFASVDGLDVSGVDKEQGMDTSVRFRLQGSVESIDRALMAADFTTAMRPGSDEFQVGPEVDVAGLDDVGSASDVWVDAYGVPIHRQVLRCRRRESPETEVLFVQGFTT